jgi:hypothetical protein
MLARFLILVAILLPLGSSATATAGPLGLPADFHLVTRGPDGGTVWEGQIPNYFVSDPRLSDIYLPPNYNPVETYPVLYLLHGFWGSPGSFVHGLHFATAADTEITMGAAAPFIAVMPPGGPMTKTTSGEWAGVWEKYVIHDVIPWVDSNLSADPAERAIAGLSAGGYGAVDMGLRHLGMFQTLESWGGYFQPFRDGPFVHASARDLEEHDPVLLLQRQASLVRRDHLRIFLSTGKTGHGSVNARWTFQFSSELASLHVEHKLWVLQGRGRLWRRQLPAAIAYAEPG